MADRIYLLDRVRVATTTTGTGAYTLGAAPVGWLDPFAGGGESGRRYTWLCQTEDGATWELFEGVLNGGSPATISRSLVIRNHLGGVGAVNFQPGNKRITCIGVSSRWPYLDGDGKLPGSTIPLRTAAPSQSWSGTLNLSTSDVAFANVGVSAGTQLMEMEADVLVESGTTTACTVILMAQLRNAADSVTEMEVELGRTIVHSNFSRYARFRGVAEYAFGAEPAGKFVRYLARIDQAVAPIAIYNYRAKLRCHMGF